MSSVRTGTSRNGVNPNRRGVVRGQQGPTPRGQAPRQSGGAGPIAAAAKAKATVRGSKQRG